MYAPHSSPEVFDGENPHFGTYSRVADDPDLPYLVKGETDIQALLNDSDLPRLTNGDVDIEALLNDPVVKAALWATSVPFWSYVDSDGALRRALERSRIERKTPSD